MTVFWRCLLPLGVHSRDNALWCYLCLSNGQRVVRALEICLMTGRKFSSFKTAPLRKRDFVIEKIGIERPREELYRRIDSRVLKMIEPRLVEGWNGRWN